MSDATRLLLDRLRARYLKDGQGVEWTFVTEVSSAQGSRCDALALGMWPSHGHAIHGFELKVTRADWLRELRAMSKADPFTAVVDYWWLVVSDPRIVVGDLPIGWGLMVPHGKGLKIATQAVRREPRPMDRAMYASLTRAVGREYEQFYRERYEEREEAAARARQAGIDDGSALARVRAELEVQKGAVAAFEQASGVRLSHWRGADERTAREVGEALRVVLDGRKAEVALEARLRYAADDTARLAKEAREAWEAVKRRLTT